MIAINGARSLDMGDNMAKYYRTISGDTWDIIAKKVYGSEYRADFLMQSNPSLLDIFQFDEGMRINTPELPEERVVQLPPWR